MSVTATHNRLIQIRPWLYVGSQDVMVDSKRLKAEKIGAILQLHQPAKGRGLEVLFLPILEGQPIRQENIQQGVGFIRKQKAKGRTVLSACGAGITRSVLFAVAALKEEENLTLREAFMSIHAVHPDAMPDHQHWDSLREYYGEGEPFLNIWRDLLDV